MVRSFQSTVLIAKGVLSIISKIIQMQSVQQFIFKIAVPAFTESWLVYVTPHTTVVTYPLIN
jgi:hypothetical protein